MLYLFLLRVKMTPFLLYDRRVTKVFPFRSAQSALKSKEKHLLMSLLTLESVLKPCLLMHRLENLEPLRFARQQ